MSRRGYLSVSFIALLAASLAGCGYLYDKPEVHALARHSSDQTTVDQSFAVIALRSQIESVSRNRLLCVAALRSYDNQSRAVSTASSRPIYPLLKQLPVDGPIPPGFCESLTTVYDFEASDEIVGLLRTQYADYLAEKLPLQLMQPRLEALDGGGPFLFAYDAQVKAEYILDLTDVSADDFQAITDEFQTLVVEPQLLWKKLVVLSSLNRITIEDVKATDVERIREIAKRVLRQSGIPSNSDQPQEQCDCEFSTKIVPMPQ